MVVEQEGKWLGMETESTMALIEGRGTQDSMITTILAIRPQLYHMFPLVLILCICVHAHLKQNNSLSSKEQVITMMSSYPSELSTRQSKDVNKEVDSWNKFKSPDLLYSATDTLLLLFMQSQWPGDDRGDRPSAG